MKVNCIELYRRDELVGSAKGKVAIKFMLLGFAKHGKKPVITFFITRKKKICSVYGQ